MSRIFNVLSGGSPSRSAGVAEPARAGGRVAPVAEATPQVDDEFVGAADVVPFVEIGDPAGAVFSPGSALHRPVPQPVVEAPVPAEQPAEANAPESRTYPRLATPAYLSVTFHDISGRVRTQAEIEGPDFGLVALHFPQHPISGEYRTLRDEIRAQLPEPTPRVLLFTAAAREAGTTTVLSNLAITIAREAAPRVLLIDGNGENAAIAARFALMKAVPGLAEVLAQQVPLAWAVQPSVVPNLHVLPAGEATAATAAAIGSELPKLIEQLRQWYDWVLIDGGIWGAMPERDAACPSADAIYVVSREGDVDRSEFAALRGRVRERGGLLRGYIATRA